MLSSDELAPFRAGAARFLGADLPGRAPDEWIRTRLAETLYTKQVEIARSVEHNRRTAVKACFDSGKSYLASRLALWWIETRPPGEALVVTTATTFQQVRAILWQEIGGAHNTHQLTGRVTQTEWWIGRQLVGFGRRPRDWAPDALTGHHRPHVLVIVDEASGVPAAIFDALEGLITNERSRILAIGNPYGPGSRFAELFAATSIWHGITITAFDTPAWTGERVSARAAASLISPVWVDELREMLGADHEATALWQTKVLGEFDTEDESKVISLANATRAKHHEIERSGAPTLAVDVARYGEDETVICARWGWHIEIIETFRRRPLTYTAGRVAALSRELGAADVRVDDDGVGGGVTDMLREQGLTVDALHGAARPADPTKFADARSEWWWHIREAFAAGDPDIPDDDRLIGQLTAVNWDMDSRGRIKVESKKDMRARGAPSPDRADAVVYTTATGQRTVPVASPLSTPQTPFTQTMR